MALSFDDGASEATGLLSHRQGDRTEFVRNDAYWGGAQPWAPVSYRFIANDPARTAALPRSRLATMI